MMFSVSSLWQTTNPEAHFRGPKHTLHFLHTLQVCMIRHTFCVLCWNLIPGHLQAWFPLGLCCKGREGFSLPHMLASEQSWQAAVPHTGMYPIQYSWLPLHDIGKVLWTLEEGIHITEYNSLFRKRSTHIFQYMQIRVYFQQQSGLLLRQLLFQMLNLICLLCIIYVFVKCIDCPPLKQAEGRSQQKSHKYIQ